MRSSFTASASNPTSSFPPSRRHPPPPSSSSSSPLVLALVAAATLLSAPLPAHGAKQFCTPFQAYGSLCVDSSASAAAVESWYRAESRCRRRGGHLLRLDSAEARRDALGPHLGASSQRRFWIGARRVHAAAPWTWADGTPFNATAVSDPRTGAAATLEASPPAGVDPGPPLCLAAYADAPGGRVRYQARACELRFRSLCVTGAVGCAWRLHTLSFGDASFGSSEPFEVEVHPSGVLTRGGEDVGLGEWVSPSLFRVASVGGGRCHWVARFSLDAGTPVVVSGCEDPDTGVLANPRTGAWRRLPGCSLEGGEGHMPSFLPDFPTAKPMPTPMPTGVLPPGGSTGGGFVPDAGKDERPHPGVGKSAVDDDDSAAYAWLLPVGLGVIALVGGLTVVGAARRRSSFGKQSEEEPQGLSGSEGSQMDDCDQCKKFSAPTAHRRLRAVHEALQREFAMPLGVLDTRCDHVGNDHVHVFTVENSFDAPSLGALSTVYSRTKPRLPRNTRIHIERVKKQPVAAEVAEAEEQARAEAAAQASEDAEEAKMRARYAKDEAKDEEGEPTATGYDVGMLNAIYQ